MSPAKRSEHPEFHRELEPNILPRQAAALERVAGRLARERARPEPGFRSALDAHVLKLSDADTASTAPWRLQALSAVVAGVVLLLVAVALTL